MCALIPKNVTTLRFLRSIKLKNSRQKRSYNVISKDVSIGLLEVEGHFMSPKIPSKTSPLAFQPDNEVFIPVG